MRVLCLIAIATFTCQVLAQEPPQKRLTKPEERAKFHSVKVQGSPAAVREKAYRDRLKLEADSVFEGVKWRNIGPEYQGGRVVDIVAPKDHPEKLYVAAATGGLWRTEDDGITWTSLFDDQSAFGIGAVAASHDGKTLWVATGEANSQRTSYAGTGVFKSTDEGKTWQNVGLPESQHIGKIVIDPTNENIVYVAALGHLYSQNPERGIYKTIDGGRTWRQVLRSDDYTGAIDVVVNSKNPKIVIASLWDRDRRAWNFRESGAGSGVYRSTDGGEHWTLVRQLPVGDAAGRVGLTQCDSKPEVVYAFVDNQSFDPDWELVDERVPSGRLTPRRFLLLDEAMFLIVDKKVLEPFWRAYAPETLKLDDAIQQVKDKKLSMAQMRKRLEERSPNAFSGDVVSAEVYRSDDSGKTWHRTKLGQLGDFGGYYWGKVAVNPSDANDVAVMGVPLVRSTDGGASWKPIAEEAHVDFHAVWHDPKNSHKVWIGSDGGLFVSFNDGKDVRHIENLPLAQATTVAVDNKTPYNVYVGLQDNGTMRGPSNYVPGKSDLRAWADLFGGDGSAIAVDPRDNGDVIYMAYQFGEHFGKNQKTGETWSARARAEKGEPALRYNWISPFLVSPHHGDIVYLGAQRVYRSLNMGKKWEAISPDITKNLPNGDVPFSTIKDLSESPLKFGLLYAGCDDGTVKMTPDGGYQWIDVSTPLKAKWVSRVVASRWDVGTVYVAQSGYREDDWSAYLWKSTDYGKTWTSIVGNLPTETVNVVREDPTKKDILYVGTDMGVFVTFDGGVTWESLHGGLPHQPVHDLVIQERDKELVAATHSRGAYILPLRKVYAVTPEQRAADITLQPLDTVTRSKSWGYQPRERWDSEPPKAPVVKISFFTKLAGAGTIRIKDKDGKVVREKAIVATRGVNDLEIDLEVMPGKPGTVDVRKRDTKTAEDALKDPRAAERPQYVAEGKYTLEVEISGHKATQSLIIEAS